MASKMTAQDKIWEAENDAQILADANVIFKTPIRLKAATKQAKVMAIDAKKKAVAMNKVAKTKVNRTTRKATQRRK